MQITNTKSAILAEPSAYRTQICADPGHSISPQKLATLDYGMFRSLCNLGTPRERICGVLNISYADFDYLLDVLNHRR